jgi:hypothetical protein
MRSTASFAAGRRTSRHGKDPSWEIYGHWREDPSELETEVYYLVQRAGLAPRRGRYTEFAPPRSQFVNAPGRRRA